MTDRPPRPDPAVALVTGSGRNIGRAIALGLAEDGHDIIVNVRSNVGEAEAVAAEVRALGVRAHVGVADVADADEVDRLFREATEALGPVSVLVNAAAVRHEKPVEALDFDEWRRILGVILDGAFLCSRAAIPAMRARGWGRIVNIVGMSGEAGAVDRVHVVTAKSGLIGMTKALAVELGPTGITVNGVSPGMIATVRDTRSASGEPRHHATRNVPLDRRGTPEEVAAVVRFLASPAASYVTGETIKVNGGAYIS